MSPLIDDIQEELRREDFFNTLKKRLPWIIGAVAAVLMATAGYTFVQWRAEKNLVLYENLYEQALEKIEQKDDVGAEKLLQDVAKQCPGLEFLALMTLADMHKTNLIDMTEPPADSLSEKTEPRPSGDADPQTFLDARKKLASLDYRLLSRFSDAELSQFLSLCRLMLDAKQPWSYFGPSQLIRYHHGSKTDTVPVPLSAQDVTNSLNVFHANPMWVPLSKAISTIEYSKGSAEQSTSLKEWIQHSNTPMPLMTLMGLAQDFHR